MNFVLIKLYFYSVEVLLLCTGMAKIVSAYGNARILSFADPILLVPFRDVFVYVGLIEIGIAIICFLSKNWRLASVLVSWLSTNFLIYRIGLLMVGYHKPCSCMGNLSDALHILPQTADTAMKIILAYLLVGSYATLFWLWRQNRKASPSMAAPAATVPPAS